MDPTTFNLPTFLGLAALWVITCSLVAFLVYKLT